MTVSESLFSDVLKALENLPPPPKFDRVVVHDDRSVRWLGAPRKEPPVSLHGLLPAIFGIPVIKDSTVEVGVIEFRKGDQVYRRFHLPELRA